MHDPLHVVAELRRPPLTRRERAGRVSNRKVEADPRRRHRQFGPLCLRPRIANCYGCDENGKATKTYAAIGIYEGEPCKDCAGRGYHVIPHRRRLYLGFAFWRLGDREWFFPPVITLWHRDPELKGDDSSCSRPFQQKAREAKVDGRFVARAWWLWCARHYGWWHFSHYHVQIIPLEALRRWLFSRCAYCSKQMPFGYSPISGSWDGPRPEHWWEGEKGVYHHECYTHHRAAASEGVTHA